MSFYCPNCGHKQVCPCSACQDDRKKTLTNEGIKPWKWIRELGVRCGGCGFEQGADWWASIEMAILNWHKTSVSYPIEPDVTKETIMFLEKLEGKKI